MPASILRLLGASLLLAVGACKRPAGETAAALPAARVAVAPVSAENLPVLIETSGTVRAVQRAAVAAKVSGQIDRLNVTLGQAVRAGDVLLHLASAELSARVAQGSAQLAQARRELARERTLQAAGAGTADSVQAMEDRLAQVEAAIREAESMLAYATVTAPFDGVVAKKFAETGDFASPGQPLLQLDGQSSLEVEAGIPESLATTLKPGATLAIEVPSAGLSFAGTVTELSSAADATVRDITAKLAVPAGTAVRPGQFARVFVSGPVVPALLIPVGALSPFGQMERVYAVGPDQRAALRLVKTGARRGDRIEILSGLEATDRVVLAPPAALRDGQPLQIVP